MKPNIENYHDYLEFLKDWTEYLKEKESGFSLRKIAKEAGIASGYLPMCFSRKRTLSTKFYEKIKPFLKLSSKEKRFLDLLRLIAESEIPSQRVQALTDLQKLNAYKKNNHSELETHQYLSRWYYVGIRELVNLPDFKNDPAWIQARLRGRVSQKEISEGLDFLLKYNFLLKDSNGNFKVAKKQLSCHDGVYKISLGELHRQMLDIAKASIEEVSREQRLLLGHTAALSKEQYDKVQEILRNAINKIETVDGKSHVESEVYHVEIAAFPLTKKFPTGSGSVGE
ncbi:MAG: DUF4423 domain-containing protein [Bdellovibrionaceae bacterium]|nr:DUF4423 domain-containing protein [Bdellovibrio sp.]